MTGKVITVELNNNLLESGAIVVIKNASLLEICTVLHIDQAGQWVVMGQSFDMMSIGARDELCKLIVASDDKVYPLKFNQWDKAIKNSEVNSSKEVTFELVSQKFNPGKYLKNCSDCTTNYMGARNQLICKNCSDKDVTAKIIIGKQIKPKRPRIIRQQSDMQMLLATAYEMGKEGKNATQFNKWLQKQL